MLDAMLDQARYRVTHPENFPELGTNQPKYDLRNFIRYLHLEKPTQWERCFQNSRSAIGERWKYISINFGESHW
jgi:hypothetical protein